MAINVWKSTPSGRFTTFINSLHIHSRLPFYILLDLNIIKSCLLSLAIIIVDDDDNHDDAVRPNFEHEKKEISLVHNRNRNSNNNCLLIVPLNHILVQTR